MPISLSRNTITLARDGDVWRATLGSDANTGVSSAASCPFDAIALTLAKAREQTWAFDGTEDAPAPAETAPADGEPAAEAPTDAPAPEPEPSPYVAPSLDQMVARSVKPAPVKVVPKPATATE